MVGNSCCNHGNKITFNVLPCVSNSITQVSDPQSETCLYLSCLPCLKSDQ